jgi:dTDP-4-dehydrorhamnose reductase
MAIRVLVLGANGMLGATVSRVLASDDRFDVISTTRHGGKGALAFDAGRDAIADLLDLARCSWIVNAIGILERHIDEYDPSSVAAAIDVNASLPNRLVAAAGQGRRVLQISSDGIFSGKRAPYDERSPTDADGVYAKSKALGEVRSDNVLTLRCSIVGVESAPANSLLGWALSQPLGARISGYTNHRWNGITTLHFAKLCAAAILADHQLPSLLHPVPADSVSKAQLLQLGLEAFGRKDVTVVPEPAAVAVDRTLHTVHPEVIRRLWAAAGYPHQPTIAQMLNELASFGE